MAKKTALAETTPARLLWRTLALLATAGLMALAVHAFVQGAPALSDVQVQAVEVPLSAAGQAAEASDLPTKVRPLPCSPCACL